jgi:hypothetical protein
MFLELGEMCLEKNDVMAFTCQSNCGQYCAWEYYS